MGGEKDCVALTRELRDAGNLLSSIKPSDPSRLDSELLYRRSPSPKSSEGEPFLLQFPRDGSFCWGCFGGGNQASLNIISVMAGSPPLLRSTVLGSLQDF